MLNALQNHNIHQLNILQLSASPCWVITFWNIVPWVRNVLSCVATVLSIMYNTLFKYFGHNACEIISDSCSVSNYRFLSAIVFWGEVIGELHVAKEECGIRQDSHRNNTVLWVFYLYPHFYFLNERYDLSKCPEQNVLATPFIKDTPEYQPLLTR